MSDQENQVNDAVDIKKKTAEFISILNDVMKDLPRPCTVKDIAKGYHQVVKQNVQKTLDELVPDSPILYNFLRFQCTEICEVRLGFLLECSMLMNFIILHNCTRLGHHERWRCESLSDNNQRSRREEKDEKEGELATEIEVNLQFYPIILFVCNPALSSHFSFPRLPLAVIRKKNVSNPQWQQQQQPKFSNATNQLDSEDVGDDEFAADYIYDRSKHKSSLLDFVEENGDMDDWTMQYEDEEVHIDDSQMFPKLSTDDNASMEEKMSSWVTQTAALNIQEELQKPASPPKPTGAVLKRRDPSTSSCSTSVSISSDDSEKRAAEVKPATVSFNHEMFIEFYYPKRVLSTQAEIPTRRLKCTDIHNIRINVFHSREQFIFEDICPSHSYFMHQFTSFYNKEGDVLKIREVQRLTKKLLVAVRAGNWWLRAKIISVEDDMVNCCFVDSGVVHEVRRSEVSYMMQMFLAHPLNSFLGSCIRKPELRNDLQENLKLFNAMAGKRHTVKIHQHDQKTGVYEIEKLTH